ncbi:MAG: lipopolysaccharide biosynthesis protein [Clostridiales bacterium]|nr:lipopolysaccharide biosynthesis protein [Clostridiales bacterium]
MTSQSLGGNKVIKNLSWRFAERMGARGVEFIVSIILARLLDTELYGTIALIMVFISIMQVFVDSGLGNALIQKKDADNVDFSTVFYFNLTFCIVLYALLFLLSPIIASFYDDPLLTPVIRVLGLTILISGVKNVQQAYVSKHLLFKKFFFATLGGTIFAAIAGIALAYYGYGIWALVAQQVLNVAIDTIILWIVVKWRPQRSFSLERLRGLLRYGWKLLVSSLLETGYNELRQLIIGKMYTKSDLAYYDRASQFPRFITSNINTSIDSVLFPAMSGIQDDRERVKNMTRRSIKVSTFIMAPLMAGLAMCSTQIVSILLTEKWMPIVPYLIIMCITYTFMPIHTANLNAIKALGRSDLFLTLEIIKKCVGLTILLISMQFGVMAIAYSLLVSSVLGQIINSWPNKKLLNYSYIDQLKDIMPSIIIAWIMGGAVYFIKYIGLNDYFTLAIQIVLGALIYILLSKLCRIDSFEYSLNMVKDVIKNRGAK